MHCVVVIAFHSKVPCMPRIRWTLGSGNLPRTDATRVIHPNLY